MQITDENQEKVISRFKRLNRASRGLVSGIVAERMNYDEASFRYRMRRKGFDEIEVNLINNVIDSLAKSPVA